MYFDPAQEAREDEIGAMYGDARRCPRHPHVKTSSDDGMFDCDCGECEYESEMAYQEWECNPDNPTRLHCAPETYIASQATHTVGCDDTDEEIPF